MTDFELFRDGDEVYVDSRLIAERLGIEHRSFLETLDTYQTEIEQAFGILRFETAKLSGPGRPPRFAYLNEDQATFVMTLSRNSTEVVQCKLDLVQSFSKAKKIIQLQQRETVNRVPYWYQRIRLALSDTDLPLQVGYFCIYQEMMRFFAELEGRLGYVVPDQNPFDGKYLIPDISVGSMFNKFLRSEDDVAALARKQYLGSTDIIDFRQPRDRKDGWFPGGKNHQEILMYNHVYPKASHGEYQTQKASSYPVRYLSIFQYFLQEYWIPDNCVKYLSERDPQGVHYLRATLSELPPSTRQSLAGTLIGKLMFSLPEGR